MDCSSSQNYYVIILWWYFYKLFSILTIYIIAKVYLNWFTHTHAFTYTLLYTHLASSMSLWGSFLRQISKRLGVKIFSPFSHLVFWFGLTNILHSRKNKIKADKFYYCPLIWHNMHFCNCFPRATKMSRPCSTWDVWRPWIRMDLALIHNTLTHPRKSKGSCQRDSTSAERLFFTFLPAEKLSS